MEILLRKQYLKFINYWLITLLSLISIIVIVGGLTRLTDSGLSITTWDVFKGIMPPLNNKSGSMHLIFIKKYPNTIFLT